MVRVRALFFVYVPVQYRHIVRIPLIPVSVCRLFPLWQSYTRVKVEAHGPARGPFCRAGVVLRNAYCPAADVQALTPQTSQPAFTWDYVCKCCAYYIERSSETLTLITKHGALSAKYRNLTGFCRPEAHHCDTWTLTRKLHKAQHTSYLQTSGPNVGIV